ncbi:hypothetical protein QFC20_006180 [Naganishia adeliensis]|uniref:Uncharacterized protein n=1 Tax=Naganishia adeliensis TaxID=92952 RepID=A0ACC2VE08_9TREE|nr:hypothetical protein QFC20_006180 [Naganishia adeliensis]
MAATKGSKKAAKTDKKRNSPRPQTSKSQSATRRSRPSTRSTRRASTPLSEVSVDHQPSEVSASPVPPPAPPKLPRPTAKRHRIREGVEDDSASYSAARLEDITTAFDRAANADDTDRAAERREAKQARKLKKAKEENKRFRQQLQESQRVNKGLGVERSSRSVDRPSEHKRNNPYEVAPLRQVLGLEVLASDPDVLKELKNETYNYLRFIVRINKGGALKLTFYHSLAAPDVKRYTLDWPVNELLKTVLRDQRVQMLNARSKVLYGNALYNELLEQYSSRYPFPSAPVVRHLKTAKQGKIGRPRKDQEKQQALAISSASRKNLKTLENTLRANYRALWRSPEFDFEENGKVVMPPYRPLVKKIKDQSEAGLAPATARTTSRSLSASSPPADQAALASNASDLDMVDSPEQIARRQHALHDGVNLDDSGDSSAETEHEYGDEDDEEATHSSDSSGSDSDDDEEEDLE